MSFRRLMSEDDDGHAKYRPYINTGSPLDILNGKYIPGTRGNFILSGGAGLTTAIIAEANKFKSSVANGSAINAMARFPDSEFYLFDSEYSTIDKQRLSSMSNLYLDDPSKRTAHLADLQSRIRIYDPTTDEGSSLDAWFDFMKELRDKKVANAKDWEVETEIIDPDTRKPYRMLLPTFFSIDSWTEAHVKQLNIKNEEITADTEMSKQRTVFMEEGLKKSMLMRQLMSLCAKGGFNAFLTGHVGKKFSIDGRPMKKDMAYMGQDETIKAMGNKFYFLMSSIFKIANTSPLTDKNDRRESEYPSAASHISGTELQELMVTLVRAKNSNSGYQTQLVSSQKFGLLAGLSYYNYLRNTSYFGLGSANKVRSPLLGDMNLGRTKILDASRSYEVARALELTYELCVIQTTWTLAGQPIDFTIPIDQFVDKLQQSGYGISDILNSRGWWTYTDAKVDRPYLTLPDVLAIITGAYKPKLFPVS